MNKEKLILEAGGEGGSVKLVQIKNYYLFSTNETTLREFVPDLTLEELTSKSNVFTSFAEAMESLLEKYPIFHLHPLETHPDFKNEIFLYYQRFCSESGQHENWNKRNWDNLLFDQKNTK
jgi:hypothetical protein